MRNFRFELFLIMALVYVSDAAAQPKLPVAGKGIALEVVIVEVPGPAGTIAESATMTQEKILELEKEGKIGSWSRVQLTTLESQTAVMQFAERSASNAPKPASGIFRLGGDASGQERGTIVQITPRVEDDGSVIMILDVHLQNLVEPSPAPGTEKKEAAAAAKTTMVKCGTTLRVLPGKWVVTGTKRADKEPSQTWIAVTAKVLEAK